MYILHAQFGIRHLPLCILFLLTIFPLNTHAAEMSFSVVSNPVVGDTATIVEVYIDPQNAPVNVVEGVLRVENSKNSSMSILVETGGSLLTLWPVRPEYDANTHSIFFTGGSRAPLLNKGLLLRLRVFSASPASVKLSWINTTMYLGDGKATIEPVANSSITIALEKGTPNPINPFSADSIPPVFDSIEMGKDDEIYDGKDFLHITTTDNKSGIDRIEVTENGIVTEAKNDTYVFQEQDKQPEVLVTTYDNAGNSTSYKYPPKKSWFVYFGLFLLIFVLFVYFVRKRNQKYTGNH